MLKLSCGASPIDAVVVINGCNMGKIVVELQEEGFSWRSERMEPVRVKYSEIVQYGTSYCQHDDQATPCLFVQYKQDKDAAKGNEKCTHIHFVDEFVSAYLFEKLLDFVDSDPQNHHHYTPSNQLESDATTSRPHILRRSIAQVSCITTSFVKTQVTFLRFFGNLLLAGIGDVLEIFVKDADSCWSFLTKRQIFQGHHVHGLQVTKDNYIVVHGGKKVCFLKLYSTGKCRIRVIYSFEVPDWVLDCLWLESKEIAFLTANNALFLYNLSVVEPSLKCVHYCCERCILYSGTIIGKTWRDIVVLAGTVFSTIVIWKNYGDCPSKDIIHRLEGHRGVIFSIAFCEKNQRICSTSDDRTVRVWDVVFQEPCNWNTCTLSLKLTLYGHSARVWRSSLLECGNIVSVGEDSRICLWSGDGTLETQFCGHQEGEIWGLDVSEDLQCIATGGSDGGISLWPITKAPVPHELELPGQNLKPKCVGLSVEGQPFMVSWDGDVFLFTGLTWKLCLGEPELKSYCLHAVSPNHLLVAFASITGRLIICQLVEDSLLKVVDAFVCSGRIFSITWMSNASLSVCGPDGELTIWKMSTDCEVPLKKEVTFVLPPSKERWVTACAADGNYVLCGDRCGSLHLYVRDGSKKNPVYTAKKIHGHNGVTDVKFLNGNFVSTGRDGKYREFIIENNVLILLRCVKLKLDWIAAVNGSDLLGRVLFCFHEMFFTIWNIKDRREILKIDCGGGHRSWDCTVSNAQKRIIMTFIKGKSVKYCRIPIKEISGQSLLAGNHPKSINCAESLNFSGDSSRDKKLILLGGEDTTLRLVSVSEDPYELCVLQGHLSSVRAVACHRSSQDGTQFIASGGGRGQLVLWKSFVATTNSVTNMDAIPDIIELNSYSLISLMKELSSDAAEMRIMDLQLYQISSVSLMVAACCSDGMLRIFSYAIDSNEIHEVQSVDCQNCLLQVRVCYFATDPMLIVTTTSGMLLIFPIGSSGLVAEEDTKNRFLISETGINCCDQSELNGNLVVACAGDDALVNILLFERNSDLSLKIADNWSHNAAHTCQVPGLRIVENFVFTAGLDQRLAIFSWTVSGSQICADMIHRVDLCIPDVHGLLVWARLEKKTFEILVYGLGTQLLEFPVKTDS